MGKYHYLILLTLGEKLLDYQEVKGRYPSLELRERGWEYRGHWTGEYGAEGKGITVYRYSCEDDRDAARRLFDTAVENGDFQLAREKLFELQAPSSGSG